MAILKSRDHVALPAFNLFPKLVKHPLDDSVDNVKVQHLPLYLVNQELIRRRWRRVRCEDEWWFWTCTVGSISSCSSCKHALLPLPIISLFS